ncbi:LysR family transcriptional regulator (plasmid) [Agrobacterium vitis]|uniref:LysR family transcriptional regulator n=1 Tax=Agrobacterium vitis TaxID=373 RepID=UPI0012E8BB55|nr:LysR family transcriptional regulator [Agrobacterium vitis]MVA27296.1 LysR family transcriptional regulator [Agrobacterium vitis]
MDTHFLESFVAVAELGSIAEAARRLDLTASAVSQRIGALEAEMNIELVSRSGRTVLPTPAGTALLPEAKKVLQAISNLRLLAAEGTIWGDFKIGVFTSALTGFFPPILEKLIEDLPNVDFFLVRAASDDLYPQLLRSELDAAIVIKPNFALPKSVDWIGLRKEALIAITPEHVSERDIGKLLSDHKFIRYDRNNWGGRIANRFLEDRGLKPMERLELDSLEAIAVLVDRGLGISIIPDWAPPWPEGLRLNKIVLDTKDYARDIGIVWPRASPKMAIIETFVKHARAICELKQCA